MHNKKTGEENGGKWRKIEWKVTREVEGEGDNKKRRKRESER